MEQVQNDADDSIDRQSIEQLQQRYQELHKRKIQAETQRDTAQDQLKKLKKQALEKYGTDNVAELNTKLEQMKTENEEKRAKYQADLDKIDHKLLEVEKKFAPKTAVDDEEPF